MKTSTRSSNAIQIEYWLRIPDQRGADDSRLTRSLPDCTPQDKSHRHFFDIKCRESNKLPSNCIAYCHANICLYCRVILPSSLYLLALLVVLYQTDVARL